ncbi:hypothetical protein CsatA_026522 [Cannabis sativa]
MLKRDLFFLVTLHRPLPGELILGLKIYDIYSTRSLYWNTRVKMEREKRKG